MIPIITHSGKGKTGKEMVKRLVMDINEARKGRMNKWSTGSFKDFFLKQLQVYNKRE